MVGLFPAMSVQHLPQQVSNQVVPYREGLHWVLKSNSYGHSNLIQEPRDQHHHREQRAWLVGGISWGLCSLDGCPLAGVCLTGTLPKQPQGDKKLRWGKGKKWKSRRERKTEIGRQKAGDSSLVCQNR